VVEERTSARAALSAAEEPVSTSKVELIFEGPPVDGAAFDFLEVDAVAGEGFKSGEERAGL